MAANCHSNSRRSLVGCGGRASMPAGASRTARQKAALAGETPARSHSPPYASLDLVLPSSPGGPGAAGRGLKPVSLLPDSCLHNKGQPCCDKRPPCWKSPWTTGSAIPTDRSKSSSLLTMLRVGESEAGRLWGRHFTEHPIVPGLCCSEEKGEGRGKERGQL